MTFETTSSGPRTFPPNASSVHSSTIDPGRMLRTGATPPNVHANSAGSGRYATTVGSVTTGSLPLEVRAAREHTRGSPGGRHGLPRCGTQGNWREEAEGQKSAGAPN